MNVGFDYDSDYTEASLCFPIRGGEVLLAEKQKKIGAGFLNGFGGKAKEDDLDIYDTNIREVEEEIGIRIKAVKKFGEVAFHNPTNDKKLKKMMVHIFITTEWDGEPKETDEMKMINWHKIEDIDYSKFLPADRLFLPQILSGRCIRGLVEYNDDWSIKSSHIEEVEAL